MENTVPARSQQAPTVSLRGEPVMPGGLAGAMLFESMLSTLRAYLLGHTASRIDVELGARAFRHLLALPLA